MKCLWQILVPCNYNDGKPVRTRHHREWDRRVRSITGGLTILPPGKGQWVDPATAVLYQDRVIPVQIIATAEEMERIADITNQHYRQLAVMYFKMSETAIIREAA
ncbi:hypothetical protein FJ949_09480 [Mesorhizobium sp. B2-4-1]|nr:hypothetical protein FJ949_09480 [Mesorhizobium sp. B2-4-1]